MFLVCVSLLKYEIGRAANCGQTTNRGGGRRNGSFHAAVPLTIPIVIESTSSELQAKVKS